MGLTFLSSHVYKRVQRPPCGLNTVWSSPLLITHSFGTHGKSKIDNKPNRVGDPGTALFQEHVPPMRNVGHTVSHTTAELLRALGATVEPELLPVAASRSKTEKIKCLILICSVRSFQAKGTLNYRQPHSKRKSVKHLPSGTPHPALGLPGFSRPHKLALLI